jgi:hypothetical protein
MLSRTGTAPVFTPCTHSWVDITAAKRDCSPATLDLINQSDNSLWHLLSHGL